MKVLYCRRYDKYVSQQYCEFFNEGCHCEFYDPAGWNTIRDLLQDAGRPQLKVDVVSKPLKCKLIDRTGRSFTAKLRALRD